MALYRTGINGRTEKNEGYGWVSAHSDREEALGDSNISLWKECQDLKKELKETKKRFQEVK